MRFRFLLLLLSVAAGLRGWQVDGFFDSAAREIPHGCSDNDCLWTVEHLLTYYGVGLDKDGLQGALRDPRADIRSMAAFKLGNDRVTEAIPWLAEALAAEKAIGTRTHMANALAQLGDKRGQDALESLCQSAGQSDPRAEAAVRIAATGFLARYHKTVCNDAIIDTLHLLERPDTTRNANLMAVGLAAANYLESPTESQVAAIREIAQRWISDQDMGVRQSASMALARYGDVVSYQKLKAALAIETDAWVRTRMGRDLRKMEGKPEEP
jgi:HEAT repeat protein